ncbi:MAG: TonB-dependent receptor [Rhodocyclaceae bacterium]
MLLAASSASVTAQETVLDAVVVTANKPEGSPGAARLDARTLPERRAVTSDTARLLEDIPGASTYGAGGISSLPVIRGLADDRLRTTVDGMDLMTACPNHMNPALSFIDPSKVESVEVFAGITPVSVGGDSIGSTVRVKSAEPKFAKAGEGLLAEGEAGLFQRSNGNARGKNFRAMLAGERFNLALSHSQSESGDYRAAGDFKKPGLWKTLGVEPVAEREVGSSGYGGSRNTELGLALRLLRDHVIELKAGEQDLGYEGFPNQRMDMVWSVADPVTNLYSLRKDRPSNMNGSVRLRYSGQYAWGGLEASLFRQHLRHHMDMLPDRFLGMFMPMDAESTTVGGLIQASVDLGESDVLRIGYDFQNYRYDDWWPPIGLAGSMCCNEFWNVRDGRRDRAYVFAEWEARRNPAWMTLLGVRGGTVESDAGPVQGYNTPMYGAEAAAFNARDRARKDKHLDWTLLARFTPDAKRTYEAGIARKTRSPNLLERYPWTYESMAMSMNNFVGDGNAYVGNMDLKPEIAHTASASGDWHDANRERWNVKLSGYLTYVEDFIDAERCTPAMSTRCSALNATTTSQYVKLRYANRAARLYGFDLSGKVELGRIESVGSFSLSGLTSFVRGENRSTGDDLYHMMPLNLKLALVHRLGGWTNTIEAQMVEAKDRVSHVRNEIVTPDYTLVNVRTSYEWKHARLDVALENALDAFYLLPLGGAYLGQGNSMVPNAIPYGMVVPGRARSLNVALNVKF